MSEVILEVKDLKKYFKTPKGTVHAVDGLNLTLEKGKTLGIVGESGCGKSTTGRVILRLLEQPADRSSLMGRMSPRRHLRKCGSFGRICR